MRGTAPRWQLARSSAQWQATAVACAHHASRITHHASRITHHASRITHHASRIGLIQHTERHEDFIQAL
jgi:hypothetical protein